MENSVSQDVCAERHKALENYLSNDKNKLEQHDLEIRDFKEAMVVLTALNARHERGLDDHECRIRGIEAKPAKQWESIVSQVITIVVAAMGGGAIVRLFP